jgi:hypothetical protein
MALERIFFQAFAVVALASFVAVARRIISRAPLSQLSQENTYKFLRLLLLSISAVVSIFLVNNLVLALSPPILPENRWRGTAMAAQSKGIKPPSYAAYRSSASALLQGLKEAAPNIPEALVQGVEDDIKQGRTGNVVLLARLLRDKKETPARGALLTSSARYLYAQGAIDAATSAFEDAAAAEPLNANILRAYILFLADVGSQERAIQVATSALSRADAVTPLDKYNLALLWDTFGLIYSNRGLLSQSDEAFQKAISFIDEAINEGRVAAAEAGPIRNDAAAIAILKRDFPEARRLLCRAIELSKSGDPSSAQPLSSKANLSSVFREQGLLGDARWILENLQREVNEKLESGDDLRGVVRILLGQVLIYEHDFPKANELLNEADRFFATKYRHTGASPQRLGRIFQLRQLMAYLQRDWNSFRQSALSAAFYFDKASGRDTSFDKLDVAFLNAAAAASQNDFDTATAMVGRITDILRELGQTNQVWTTRAAVMNDIIRVKRGNSPDKNTAERGLKDAFLIEQVKGSYDVQTDILIDALYSPVSPTFEYFDQFRRVAGAQLATLDRTGAECF